MLIRSSPASRRARAWRLSVEPLVVSDRSIRRTGSDNAASFDTSSVRLALIVGSPPVRRIESTPNRFTSTEATASISSKVSTSWRGSHSRPSSGMQ